MELKFDSISELEQFLMFSAHIGRAFAQAPQGPAYEAEKQAPQGPAYEAEKQAPQGPAYEEVKKTRHEDGSVSTLSVGAPPDMSAQDVATAIAEAIEVNAYGKPKRTRRTKAEMDAARAVETATQPEGRIEAAAIIANPTGTNPFAQASPATQAILEAPNQSAAVLAGMAAMQSNPPTEEPAAPARAIESIEHLRACQSFIQAHGMTKYNESFRDGLSANIAAYTPEQRAQHVAILETLAA